MRYAESEANTADRLAVHASDDMLLFTAVMGVIIGIVLVYLGRLGRQLWMRVWGIGLVGMSVYMGVVTWSKLVPGS